LSGFLSATANENTTKTDCFVQAVSAQILSLNDVK
jgi:hypothetical protein